MSFVIKKRNKFLYKKLLFLRKNVQNNKKVFRFNKIKWKRFQEIVVKFQSTKFYDPLLCVISNFTNFFNNDYKNTLLEKQRFSTFYGLLKEKYSKKIVKLVLKSKKIHPVNLLIKNLEIRLDSVLYRTYFSTSFSNARQLISHKKVYVNNKVVHSHSFKVRKGDLITFDKSIYNAVKSNLVNAEVWFLPPKHYCINYKTLQIFILDDSKRSSLFTLYPFWINVNSFLRFYKK